MKKVSVIKQSPGGANRAELCWAQLDSPHPLNLTRGVTTTFSTLSLVQFCLDNGVHFKEVGMVLKTTKGASSEKKFITHGIGVQISYCLEPFAE